MTAALPQKDYQPDASGPLTGVRVLDLSRLVAGNMLTQVLGDFGAEVIKVEPPAGDTLRAWQTNGVQTNWKIYARNKKSLGLELRKPEAREPARAPRALGRDVRRELPPRHAGGDGARAAAAARAQPEARHRAHLRLGPGRALPAAPRLRHAGRRHVGFRFVQRFRRPRAGAAADVPGGHGRRALRRGGRDDRAARSGAERRPRPGDRPAAARSPVRRARAAGRQLPADRQGEAAHRQPLDQRRPAQRLPLQGRPLRVPVGVHAEDGRAAVPLDRPAGPRSTTRATAPMPSA